MSTHLPSDEGPASNFAQAIVETLHEPLLILSPDLVVRSANDAFYSHFEVEQAETIGRKIYDLGNGQWNIPALRTLLEEVLPDNSVFNDFEVEHRFETIGHRIMLVNARRLDHAQLILLGIRDITDASAAQRAVRASEARLRAIVNIPGVGVLIFNSEGVLIDANDAFMAMSGYTRDDIRRRRITWNSLTPPEFADESERQLKNLETTGHIGPYEKMYVLADGSRSWMLFAGADLKDGTIVQYAFDISDRKRAEQELQSSRQRLAGMYASAKVGISEVTADGRFVRVNDELCRIMGRTREEILAGSIRDLTHPDDVDACLTKMDGLFRTGESFTIDKRYLRPDGSSVFANSTASLLQGSDPLSMVVVTVDLTARRSAETAMRASEARLHALVSATSDVVFRISPDWRQLRRIEGDAYLDDATDGEHWLERYIPDEEHPAILAAIEQAKADGDIFELEHRVLRVDGSIGWMHSKAVPVKDEDGRVLEWFGAATDITPRKEAEEALKRSEAKMRLMTDSLPVLISYVDADMRYGFINHTYERWFGRPTEEIMGKPVRDVVGPKAFEMILPRLTLALSGQQVSFEGAVDYPAVGRRDVSAVYVPDIDPSGAVRGMFAMISDVTDRRQAEAALRESEERYRTLFASIDEGFCVIEMVHDDHERPIDYRFITVNPAFEAQTGIKNATGRSMRDIAPEHEEHWFEMYDEIARSGQSRRFQMAADALGRYFDVYAFPIGEPREHRVGVLFRDIAEQRRAEEALRISEQRYRLLVESAREYAMLMLDPEGVVVSWSVGAERLFGYTAKEMIGQPADVLYTEDDRAAGAARRKRERAISEGLAATDQWYRRKDGSLFWANGVLRPLEDGHPRGFVKILRDQTKQKAHEEQLRTVMAELNHRVKNTLAVVQSIASQTLRRAPDLETFRADFERRLSSIAKAHNLLTKTSWSGAELSRIIESEMSAIAGAAAKINSSGPDVTLPPHMALAIHMVLHELATNAHKYGCLSTPDGSLAICWELEGQADQQELTLTWIEKCPTPVTSPKSEGFGSRLIEQLIVYELKGRLERTFESDGVHFSLRVPMRSRVVDPDA
ncbi:MAG: PAS domain S-box protein, partial [Phycisphaerales bacterium JB064]